MKFINNNVVLALLMTFSTILNCMNEITSTPYAFPTIDNLPKLVDRFEELNTLLSINGERDFYQPLNLEALLTEVVEKQRSDQLPLIVEWAQLYGNILYLKSPVALEGDDSVFLEYTSYFAENNAIYKKEQIETLNDMYALLKAKLDDDKKINRLKSIILGISAVSFIHIQPLLSGSKALFLFQGRHVFPADVDASINCRHIAEKLSVYSNKLDSVFCDVSLTNGHRFNIFLDEDFVMICDGYAFSVMIIDASIDEHKSTVVLLSLGRLSFNQLGCWDSDSSLIVKLPEEREMVRSYKALSDIGEALFLSNDGKIINLADNQSMNSLTRFLVDFRFPSVSDNIIKSPQYEMIFIRLFMMGIDFDWYKLFFEPWLGSWELSLLYDILRVFSSCLSEEPVVVKGKIIVKIKSFKVDDFRKKVAENECSFEKVKHLFKVVFPEASNIFYDACFEGDAEKVRRLLTEEYANPNSLNNRRKQHPLYVACKRGFIEIVKLLLVHGADPNQPIKGNIYPLEASIERGDYEIVKILLDYRADLNIICKEYLDLLNAKWPEMKRMLPSTLD